MSFAAHKIKKVDTNKLFSVVERDDELSIDAIERRFAPEAFPSKMILDVGTDGVIQFPQETLPDSPKRDSWSVIRYRGLDGRTFKYEEGFETVGEKEIERMLLLRLRSNQNLTICST